MDRSTYKVSGHWAVESIYMSALDSEQAKRGARAYWSGTYPDRQVAKWDLVAERIDIVDVPSTM